MATLAREKFLLQASALLKDSSPTIAQQSRLDLLSLQRLAGSDSRKGPEKTCQACGSDDIESQKVKAELAKQSKSQRTLDTSSSMCPQIAIHKCRKCSRTSKEKLTIIAVPSVPKIDNPSGELSKSGSIDGNNRTLKVQKTSSKKRAKERKDHEGLRAILNKRVDGSQSSNTFNLMDFMSSQG